MKRYMCMCYIGYTESIVYFICHTQPTESSNVIITMSPTPKSYEIKL
jgi:hypothetical protein